MAGERWVQINDVGPRDGLQNQSAHLSVEQRVQLICGLIEAGVPSIEVGSFVSPKAVPAMVGCADILSALSVLKGVDYQVLIPNLKGYLLARDAGAKSVMMVVCSTETMNQKNVGLSVEQSVAAAAEIVRQAQQDGIKVQACTAVAWECPFEGKTPEPSVFQLTDRLSAMGVDELIIADTIGAANPDSVHALMSRLIEREGAERLTCHFHDTRAMGMANVYAALMAGIRKFDASVGGLGGCPFAPGATGNVATEDVVMMLHQMGYRTGIDLPRLMAVGKQAGAMLNIETGGRADRWRCLELEKGKTLC
ncbi:hydroxymethylglutaryl-CoA lyase [Aestuariicella hydrocarbonica]|uniref:Hydroxymethylglutaryl-CoA lyase n=1 Tax=Pseudomaricurvus hydrocarbonicus TaxID=1470433 RepID=A0A9E5MN48_9GAMM|nr:hydroxymethylglutaryl-CoA lyase [Aestuariicella hydrocarbonica]NHO67280.1 hydroxymethylglutaryl-CoA lyase [Aestuariicella hydrocarbonica]